MAVCRHENDPQHSTSALTLTTKSTKTSTRSWHFPICSPRAWQISLQINSRSRSLIRSLIHSNPWADSATKIQDSLDSVQSTCRSTVAVNKFLSSSEDFRVKRVRANVEMLGVNSSAGFTVGPGPRCPQTWSKALHIGMQCIHWLCIGYD